MRRHLHANHPAQRRLHAVIHKHCLIFIRGHSPPTLKAHCRHPRSQQHHGMRRNIPRKKDVILQPSSKSASLHVLNYAFATKMDGMLQVLPDFHAVKAALFCQIDNCFLALACRQALRDEMAHKILHALAPDLVLRFQFQHFVLPTAPQ